MEKGGQANDPKQDEQQGGQVPQVGAVGDGAAEYKAALTERDEKIASLKAQIAEAAK